MWLLWVLTAILSAIGGAGGAFFLMRFPLLSCLDYDINLVWAVVVSLLSSIVAASNVSVKHDRSPATSAVIGASSGIFFSLGMLVIHYALGSKCGFEEGLKFFAALPISSSIVSAAVGSLCGVLLERFVGAIISVLVVIVWILASATITLLGPGVFAFNPFFGYFPGPLYDEAVWLVSGFWLYRLFNLIYALGFLGAAQIVWRGKFVGTEERQAVLSNWSVVLAALAGIASLAFGGFLGFRPSAAQIKRELGASLPFAYGNIYYRPSSKDLRLADLLKDDLEFRAYKVSNFLDERSPNFDCYLYASAAQKKRLIGAGRTLYVDINGATIHLNPFTWPHRLLQHEVAHITSRSFGVKPFGFSLRPGLIEGFAVAAEGSRDEFSIHEWAKALMGLKLSRSPAQLMDIGFWRESQGRSYVVAGSFVEYLKEKYGVSKLKFAYPFGEFQTVYHEGLESLDRNWKDFLENEVKGSKYLLERAKVKFEQPPIFERKCVREMARIEEKAGRMASSSPYKAAMLLQKAHKNFGDDDSLLIDSAEYLLLADDPYQAKDILVQTLERGDLLTEQKADGKILLGDICALLGQYDSAQAAYKEVLTLPVAPSTKAQAQLRAGLGASPPALVSAIKFLRLNNITEIPTLMEESKGQAADAPYAAYLVGHWFIEQGEVDKASKQFFKASNGIPVKYFELWQHTTRQLGLCQYLQKNFSQAESSFLKMKIQARYSGEQMEAQDLLDRVKWKRAQK